MLRNSPFILKSIICEPLCNTSPPNIVGSCVVDRLILSAPERDLSAVFKFSCCSAFNGTTEVTVYSASLDSLLLKSKYLFQFTFCHYGFGRINFMKNFSNCF